MLEKDYTLLISKYMYDRFRELGIPVTLTRDSDVTLSPSERTQRILNAYGNNPNVVVISNHLNAGGGTGAEVIYALRNSPELASSVLKNIGLTGQSTRRAYQRTLPSNPGKDYYFIHRDTGNTEPIIVEYGFIDDIPSNVQFLNNNYVLNFLSEKKPNIFLFIYLATLCGLWDLSFSIRDEPRPLAVKSAESGPLGTSPKSSILKCALHKLFKSFSKFF